MTDEEFYEYMYEKAKELTRKNLEAEMGEKISDEVFEKYIAEVEENQNKPNKKGKSNENCNSAGKEC